jgi:hypothetical protein
MKNSNVIRLIKSDLYRYYGRTNFLLFLKAYFSIPGFNYSVKLRLTKYLDGKFYLFPFFVVSYLLYKRAV